MLRLILGTLRGRPGNVAGAFVAIATATALIAATVLLMFAASGADVTSDRLAGASIVVQVDPVVDPYDSDPERLPTAPAIDPALAMIIAGVPGVSAAIPDTAFYAQLTGRTGEPISGPDDSDTFGYGWTSAALTPFTLIAGHAPAAGNEIAIDQRLATTGGYQVGDQVTVLSAEMPASYTISGIVTPPDSASLPRQSTIFFAPETANRIAGSAARADQIGVIAAAGVDLAALTAALEAELGNENLRFLTDNDRAKADPTSDEQLFADVVALLGTMAGFAGFVSIFVVSGTFAFSILQRHRELGLLRSVGMTPWQMRKMIATEALLIALTGAAVSIPVGLLLADGVARLMIRLDLAPEGFAPEINLWSFLIAIGGSIGISQLAVFSAARRASKISPIDALRESSAPKRLIGPFRLITGLAFLTGGIVLMSVASSLDADAQIASSLGIAALLLIATSRLGPLIVLPFAALLGRIVERVTQAPGELARRNSRHAAARVSSVASPLVLAIGFASLMFLLVSTTQTATIAQSRDRTTVEFVAVSSSPGLPIALVDQISQAPGVAAATGMITGTVTQLKPYQEQLDDNPDSRVTRYEVWEYIGAGVDAATLNGMLHLDLLEGSLDGLAPDEIAVSRMNGEMIGDLGEQVEIALPDGQRETFTVAAIFENGLGFADILFAAPVMQEHIAAPAVQQIYIDVEDGQADQARREIAALTAGLPAFQLLTSGEYVGGIEQSAIDGAWAIYLIIGVSVLFAGISVVNTMTMSTAERAREFALIRLIGGTDRQVRQMVLGEALIVLAIGLALGIGIGLLCMIPVSTAMVGNLSAISGPPLELAGLVALSTLIALAAHLAPAGMALRANPIDSIGLKQ